MSVFLSGLLIVISIEIRPEIKGCAGLHTQIVTGLPKAQMETGDFRTDRPVGTQHNRIQRLLEVRRGSAYSVASSREGSPSNKEKAVKLITFAWLFWTAIGSQTFALADPMPVLVLQDAGLIATKLIKFTEPSGLAFDGERTLLWSVSDNTKSVFLVPLRSGAVTQSLPVDHKQLEGVSVGLDADRLLFVREKGNLILRFDLKSNSVTRTVRLSDIQGYDEISSKFDSDEENKGLEGITVDVVGTKVFVVKEARPRLLIQISADLKRIERHWTLKADRGFKVADVSDKELDISGLAFDPRRQAIWMASDRGGCIFLFDLKTGLGHKIGIGLGPGGIEADLYGIEGIAFDETQGTIYVVSDDGYRSKRFEFSLR